MDSKSSVGIRALIDHQLKAAAAALGVSTEVAAKTIAAPQQALDFGDGKYVWKPWRDVAPSHQDVHDRGAEAGAAGTARGQR